MKTILSASLLTSSLLLTVACDKQKEAESSEDAADEMEEDMEEAAEDTEEAIEDAAEETEDEFDGNPATD